jgi:hypothetical protein
MNVICIKEWESFHHKAKLLRVYRSGINSRGMRFVWLDYLNQGVEPYIFVDSKEFLEHFKII